MPDPNQRNLGDEVSRSGTIALVGQTNVGKSTFLNAALGEPLAIVSPLPQTTRDTLLGVVRRGSAELAFVDTPGLHRPRSELGRRMNAAAWDAVRNNDLVVFMTDVRSLVATSKRERETEPLSSADRVLIDALPPRPPGIAVVNKVDLLKDKTRLLPLLAALEATGRFDAFIPMSVTRRDGVEQVLDEIEKRLPARPAAYDEETLTDKPVQFFVREYIREQVLQSTGREVPHAVAVSIDRYDEGARVIGIHATIHVEKSGQRGILIGARGTKLKEIGSAARKRIESLLGRQVHLELFVRVSPRWKSVPRQLAELGYEQAASDGPDLERTR